MDTEELDWEDVCKVLVIVVGAGGTVVLTPALLALLGFTAGGIAAGSIAAKMMSVFAVANGGGLAAWGLVPMLQSLGAGGFTWFATMLTGGAGAVFGWIISNVCHQTGPADLSISPILLRKILVAFGYTLPDIEAAGGPHSMLLCPGSGGAPQWSFEGCVSCGGTFYCT